MIAYDIFHKEQLNAQSSTSCLRQSLLTYITAMDPAERSAIDVPVMLPSAGTTNETVGMKGAVEEPVKAETLGKEPVGTDKAQNAALAQVSLLPCYQGCLYHGRHLAHTSPYCLGVDLGPCICTGRNQG